MIGRKNSLSRQEIISYLVFVIKKGMFEENKGNTRFDRKQIPNTVHLLGNAFLLENACSTNT